MYELTQCEHPSFRKAGFKVRASSGLKIAVIICLGVTSSFVTSAIMKRTRRAHAGQVSSVPAREVTTAKFAWGDAPAIIPPKGAARPFASGAMTSLKVDIIGNVAHVTGAAYIHDTRPDMQRHVWSVRVLDPKDTTKVLFEKRYDDQIFELSATQELAPTFEDLVTIPLGPGKYVLQLTVFRLHPTLGLDGLSDPKLLPRLEGPVGRAEIDIKP